MWSTGAEDGQTIRVSVADREVFVTFRVCYLLICRSVDVFTIIADSYNPQPPYCLLIMSRRKWAEKWRPLISELTTAIWS